MKIKQKNKMKIKLIITIFIILYKCQLFAQYNPNTVKT